jgi:peptide/nickel transport system ATP-binding protein
MSVVEYLSERVAVMKDGEIVESGSTEEVFRSPKHPYTQNLLASAPWIGTRGNPAPPPLDHPRLFCYPVKI